MTSNDSSITFRCPADIKEGVERFADQHRMTTSQAVRSILAMELSREESVIQADGYIAFLRDLGFKTLDELTPDTMRRLHDFYGSYAAEINDPERRGYVMALGRTCFEPKRG